MDSTYKFPTNPYEEEKAFTKTEQEGILNGWDFVQLSTLPKLTGQS